MGERKKKRGSYDSGGKGVGRIQSFVGRKVRHNLRGIGRDPRGGGEKGVLSLSDRGGMATKIGISWRLIAYVKGGEN